MPSLVHGVVQSRFFLAESSPGEILMHKHFRLQEWDCRVERGPDWVFVRLESSRSQLDREISRPLSDHVWGILKIHLTSRVVIELHDVNTIDDTLVDELCSLEQRVQNDGGLMRICGLTPQNLSKLRSYDEIDHVPHFNSRNAAIGTE